MSIDTVTRAPPPEAQRPQLPSTSQRRFSLEAMRESTPAKGLLGFLLVVIILAIIYVIVLSFTGHLTNVVSIKAELPSGSNEVPIGAPIQYRYITVGKVGSENPAPGGGILVKLLFYPSKLSQIPDGVLAQVAPQSIFGNQYVNLVPPADTSAPHLTTTDTIAAYTGEPSSSLQSTITQTFGLLNAIKPADLASALTAIATALNGEGTNLGHTLTNASSYLGAIEPHLSTVQQDLSLLQPVSEQLQASTPHVLGILQNSVQTSQTITSEASTLDSLLSNGSALSANLASTISQIQVSAPQLLNESGPLLADVTRNPNELSTVLKGLTTFASALAQAESSGPYLSVTANLPISNLNAAVEASLGYNNPTSIEEAFTGLVNPPTYTAGDCPQYPGESNPYCGVGGSPASQPVAGASTAATSASGTSASGTSASGTSASGPSVAGAGRDAISAATDPAANGSGGGTAASPYADRLDATEAIAAALNGGQAPASPGLATVILYPLLSSLAGPS